MSNKKPPYNPHFDSSRRRFIAGVAGAAGSIMLPGCENSIPGMTGSVPAAPAPMPGGGALGALPDPAESGIDHIVVVMMENRSYDHYLGWVPGGDGIQEGLEYEDNDGVMQKTFRLSTDSNYGFQGCGKEDPAHGYDTGRVHYNGGKNDGFLKTASNAGDLFPIGYYSREDVPFFSGVADHFTVCDKFFSSILSSTFPNRVHLQSGQTDRNTNTLPYAQQEPSTLPTIWDLLGEAGVSRQYYFYDLPILGLWGPKYLPISNKYEQFLIDAAAGALANVSYIDPFFGFSAGETPYGISRDDHPNADIRDGQAFLDQIYNALRNSPQWEKTLLIITYDEWGGFYDHVPPPTAPITEAERTTVGNEDGRLGFRVPTVLLGPRVRRGHVSHHQYDFSSILNLIRWRFGLGALSPRDETSINLAHALDFDNAPNLEAPSFNVPTAPFGFGKECESGLPFPLPNPPGLLTPSQLASLDPATRALVQHRMEWDSLRQLAVKTGWKL